MKGMIILANPVIMPRQGQSVESCIITAWHKKAGDAVNEGDIIFSYETDKSAFDEKALLSGTMLKTLFEVGDVVPCLETVCYIGEPGEEIPDTAPSADTAAPAAEEKQDAPAAAPAAEVTGDAPKAGERVKISPRAKNLALKTGVDMSAVAPTGPHGRIIERDINAALDKGLRTGTQSVEDFLAGKAPEKKAEEPAAAPVPTPEAEYEEVPMSGVRRAISRSMHASLSEMAQLTLNASFDATAIMEYRKALKAGAETVGLGKISINDMVMFAVSRILPSHPSLNANLVDNTLRLYRHANIGLAVDTDRGLLVPTVFHADEMSLSELAAADKAAAAKARDGSLTPDEMSGGSFTVTNLGSLGVESFTPVINPPQTAILGVCSTVNRLRADGSVYPAMGLSLTIDHRAVDGAPAAKFLKELCIALENFGLLLAK